MGNAEIIKLLICRIMAVAINGAVARVTGREPEPCGKPSELALRLNQRTGAEWAFVTHGDALTALAGDLRMSAG